jgi:Dyp-type peroxidase family
LADGISQPRIAGVDAPGAGRRTWRGRWTRRTPAANPVVEAGEFILGQPDEDDPAPVLPEPAALFRNGSYLTYRKLRQDVAAFRRFLAGAAGSVAGHHIGTGDIAAAVLGRQEDGSPLVGAPHGGDPARDFSFRSDPEGLRCPLGAHVRRANPRDGNGLPSRFVSRHRLLRRGMPYGPPYDESTATEERGLLFLAFGASISRQFEFVQRSWLNDGDAFGIGPQADILGGGPRLPAAMAVPGSPIGHLRRTEPFVWPRGGGYFFAPGIDALRRLALGAFRPPDGRLTTAVARLAEAAPGGRPPPEQEIDLNTMPPRPPSPRPSEDRS